MKRLIDIMKIIETRWLLFFISLPLIFIPVAMLSTFVVAVLTLGILMLIVAAFVAAGS